MLESGEKGGRQRGRVRAEEEGVKRNEEGGERKNLHLFGH